MKSILIKVIKRIIELKYCLLTALTGIFFLIFMKESINSYYLADVSVEWGEYLFIIIKMILHMPLLIVLFIASVFYLRKKYLAANKILLIVSGIYLILHILLNLYILFAINSFSIDPIILFPLIGLLISVININEYKKIHSWSYLWKDIRKSLSYYK